MDDVETTDGDGRKARMTADRVRKHRTRERERELQVALAAARIVAGRDPRDAARSLAAFLRRVAGRDDVPEDLSDELEASARLLNVRRPR